MILIDRYETALLRKMVYRKIIGGNDKYENAVLSGFPPHEHKYFRKALASLVKLGYVITRPKPHGTKYGLNPRQLEEIRRVLDEADLTLH